MGGRMKKIAGTMMIAVLSVCVFTGAAYGREGFGVSFHVGYYLATGWHDTHDMIYGGSGDPAFGLELKYQFDMPLELALSTDYVTGSGDEVWPDGEKTGNSISYDLTPVLLYARWRFSPETKLSPYLGIGGGFVTFKESGRGSKSGTGYGLEAGLDYAFTDHVNGYLEVEYTSFPDVIGNGDASLYYGEDDVGGTTVRLGVRYLF